MVTSSLQPKAIKQNLEIAKQLTEQGQLDEAIATYQKLIELEPNRLNFYVQLARVQEEKGDLESAIYSYEKIIELKPDNPKIYAKLAKLYLEVAKQLRKQGQLDEAISAYQKAIELQPNRLTPYIQLARIQKEKGNLEGAIASYENSLNLDTNNHNVYLQLADLYLKMGQTYLTKVIENYQKAIKVKPDLPFKIYQNLSSALKQKGQTEEANILLKSAPPVEDRKIYLNIWNALNQTNLINLEEESSSFPIQIDLKKAEQYFTQISQYKIINLASVSEKDKQLIEDAGWSLTYLKSNERGLITVNDFVEEESTENLARNPQVEQLNLPSQVVEMDRRTKFQLSMIEKGYIYAVCPATGQILRSNRSLAPEIGNCTFYRFTSKEVFYLVAGRPLTGFSKLCLYFPKRDIIIALISSSSLPIGKEQAFNRFKASIITNWQRIKSYLFNIDEVKTVVMLTTIPFGHNLWNELSGIYKLVNTGSISQVDKFLVIDEPFGPIEQIFPEIPSEKIQRLQRSQVNETILKNNYFCLRSGFNFIKEDLANRVYQTSLKLCSSDFITRVEKAKNKHSLLLCISIRLNNRTWISQTEGIVKIINNFSEHFQNLGVVIDGFSLQYNSLINSSVEKIIEEQKKTVSTIQSLLQTNVTVYNTVGCMLYESIVWAYSIDLYLAHHGTIQHKIGWTANKPGVVHTNKQTLCQKRFSDLPVFWARENTQVPIYIPENHITDITENVKKKLDEKKSNLNNYDCNWQIMYEELLKIALSLKSKR